MEWISVETRFPEKKGIYLAFDPEWGIEVVWFEDGSFNPVSHSVDRPSHWMNLPEPPK